MAKHSALTGTQLHVNSYAQAASIVADVAIANTETKVVNLSLAANTIVAGMTFKIVAFANRAGTNSATPTIRIRVGPTTLTGNQASTLVAAADTLAVANHFEGICTFRTIGASGTVLGSLKRQVHLAAVTIQPALAINGTVAVDTTVANLIELTFISGDAANTFTFRDAAIFRIV